MNRNQFFRAAAMICLLVGMTSTIHAQKVIKLDLTGTDKNPFTSGTPIRFAMGHASLAETAYRKQDYATAEKEYKEAIAALELINPVDTAFYKTYLVRVYETQNRKKEAYTVYKDLVLPKEGEATGMEKKPAILMRYAALAVAMGDIDRAAWAANKAQENRHESYTAIGGVSIFDMLPPFTGSIRKCIDLEAASQLLVACEYIGAKSLPGNEDYGLSALDRAQSQTKNDKLLAAIHYQRALQLNSRAAVLRATSDDPTQADALLEKSNREYLIAVDCDRKNRILFDSFEKLGSDCGVPMAKIKEQYGKAE